MFHRELSPGFTWRSLLAVVAVVGLVPTLICELTAQPLDSSQAEDATRSKEDALKKALFEVRAAIDQYYRDNKRYPNDLKMLETKGYIAKVPKDPFTNASDSWRLIRAQRRTPGRRTTAGIHDVKSAAKGIAMDGTRYSDW